MYKQVGTMVRYHRKLQGLSLLGLAAKAGVGKTVIFDIEHGKATVKFNTLIKVLSALDIQLMFKTDQMAIAFKQPEEAL